MNLTRIGSTRRSCNMGRVADRMRGCVMDLDRMAVLKSNPHFLKSHFIQTFGTAFELMDLVNWANVAMSDCEPF